MKIRFRKQFLKDIERVKNQSLKTKIKQVILKIEGAKSINQIDNIKSLRGFDNYFRIRIGDYRLGLYIDPKTSHFWVERFLHRKDIYKKFP